MAPSEIPLFSVGRLSQIDLEHPEEFWQGRVLSAGSCVLIAGARKSHKSDFFLELAVRAASGGIFLGRRFSRPLKVMYVQAEIRKAYLKERIETFTRHCDEKSLSLIHENLYVTDKFKSSLNKKSDLKHLSDTVNKIKPDILALDPIISYADIDENSAQQVSALLYEQIGELQTVKPSLSIVLVHHFKKTAAGADSGDVFLDVRGSSVWLGWYDTGIVLRKNDDIVTLHYETRDCRPPMPETIKLNREKGWWEVISAPASDLQGKIDLGINIIRGNTKPIMSGSLKSLLMQRLDIQERHAYHVIGELKNHPNIVTHREGRYLFFSYDLKGC